MKRFTVKVAQYVEEVAEIEVEAISQDEANRVVRGNIRSGYDYDLDWSDGDGIHHDGIVVLP